MRVRRLRLATDHDAQGRGFGTDFTAGHRRIEVLRAGVVDLRRERLGGGGRDRAHVDHHLVRRQARRNAVGAEQHVIDLRGVGHHDDDELGFLGDLLRVGQSHGASGDQLGGGRVVVRGQEQVVTGFLQVRGHWVAHDAGADKSDFSHEKILFLLLNRLNVGGGLPPIAVCQANLY